MMMKVYKTILLLAVVWLSNLILLPAQAAENVTYSGLVGKQPIVLQLATVDDKPNVLQGRLFVDPTKADQFFSGTIQSNQKLELMLESDNQHPTKFSLNFEPQPADEITLPAKLDGEWISADGKSLPLQLQQIAKDEELYGSNVAEAYAKFRQATLVLQPAEKQTVQGYHLQWLEDPLTEIRIFQLQDGYPPKILKQINQILRRRLQQNIHFYYQCTGIRIHADAESYTTVKPIYFSPTTVSVSLLTSFDCGGPHPDSWEESLNLGIVDHQVRELTLDDVLWIGKNNPTSAEHDGNSFKQDKYSDPFSDYHKKQLAPWIEQQFARLYPQEMEPSEEFDCDYRNKSVWQHPVWYFTAKGIYLGPDFGYPQHNCEGPEWSILPYAQVKKHPSWFKYQQ